MALTLTNDERIKLERRLQQPPDSGERRAMGARDSDPHGSSGGMVLPDLVGPQ